MIEFIRKHPGKIFFLAMGIAFLSAYGPDFFLRQNFRFDWNKELHYFLAIRNNLLRGDFPTLSFGTSSYVFPEFYYLFYNPETAVLSLQTFLFLIIDDFFIAFTLAFFLAYMIGCYGFYKIALLYRLHPATAFFAAMAFLLNGYFTAHISHGHGNWISTAFIPLGAFYLLRATGTDGRSAGRDLLRAAAILSLLYYGGNQHNWLIFTVVFNLLLLDQIKQPGRFLFFAISLNLAAFLWIAPKLLPFLWLTNAYISIHDMALDGDLWRGLLEPTYNNHEQDFHVGAAYALLFVLGIIAGWRLDARRGWNLFRFVLPAALLTAFACIPATDWLSQIPVLKSQGVRTRWFFGALFFLVLWHMFGFSAWLNSAFVRDRRRAVWIALVLLALTNLYFMRGKFDTFGHLWSRTELRNFEHFITEQRVPEMKREGQCLVLPTLAFEQYHKSLRARCPFENRGTKLAICCPDTLDADLRIKNTHYYEKRSLGLLLLALILSALIVWCFRFLPVRNRE